MIQSPKSKRPKAPGEKPASDGLPQPVAPHQSPKAGPAGAGPQVPKHEKGQGFKGGVQSGQSLRPVTPRYNNPSGSPGYAKDSGDGKRKGGTVSRFTDGD